MKLSFLFGAGWRTLIKLLVEHRFRISIRYIPRYCFHFVIGSWNTFFALIDTMYRKKDAPKNIVFVLGHYRSGTTHLLNLLAADGQLIAPSTYQVLFPHSFLSTEKWMAPLLNKVGPGVRAMDAMEMRMESPQEEEIALAAMGAPTPYLAAQFPVSGRFYADCLSFEKAAPKKLRAWKRAHLKFTKKLIRKNGPSATLLLKSPANTSRIPHLLALYPEAKFIYIHRDPYKTIQSSLHLYQTWYTMANFQNLEHLKSELEQTVLKYYREMNEQWLQDSRLIPSDRLVSISFAKLQEVTTEAIREIYSQLHLGTLDESKLEAYRDRIKTYKKNAYPPLSDELKLQINSSCQFIFEAYDYPMQSVT